MAVTKDVVRQRGGIGVGQALAAWAEAVAGPDYAQVGRQVGIDVCRGGCGLAELLLFGRQVLAHSGLPGAVVHRAQAGTTLPAVVDVSGPGVTFVVRGRGDDRLKVAVRGRHAEVRARGCWPGLAD